MARTWRGLLVLSMVGVGLLAFSAPFAHATTGARLAGRYQVRIEIVQAENVPNEKTGDVFESVYTFTPSCPTGPCGGKFHRSGDAHPGESLVGKFTYSDGTYSADLGSPEYCPDHPSAQGSTPLRIHVTAAGTVGGQRVATAWKGSYSLAAVSFGCPAQSESATFSGHLIPQQTGSPSPSPSPSPIVKPIGHHTASCGTACRQSRAVDRRAPGSRSRFAASVLGVGELGLTLDRFLGSIALALVLTVLIVFPCQLFNSTFDKHYDEIVGWFRRGTGRARLRFPGGWPGFALFVAIAALLQAQLDPSFSFGREGLLTYVGIVVGLVALTFAFGAPTAAYVRRHGDHAAVKVLPGGLFIAAACVAVSRLVHFSPGYLYGLIAGFAGSRAMTNEEEGRYSTYAVISTFLIAVAAWVVWEAVRTHVDRPGAGAGLLILDAILVGVFVAGLEGTLFALVPMRFLAGERIMRWNRAVWAALFATAAFGFTLVLLHGPAHGTTSPAVTVAVLFVAFGLISVAFWAYFRFRKTPPEEPVEPVPVVERTAEA